MTVSKMSFTESLTSSPAQVESTAVKNLDATDVIDEGLSQEHG
jgi:hypothetical protein